VSAAGSRIAGALGETLLWWLVATALWVVTLTERTGQELVAAALCTLPCAAAARTARRANSGSWRFRPGWLRWLPVVAGALVKQTVQVWAYVLVPTRRARSAIGPVVLPDEPAPVAAGRRAAATLALATTPGTVVLDSAAHTVLVHRIGPRPGALETAVGR
jgi:multisubunit Na+/H+ antiporter MnhE subunit